MNVVAVVAGKIMQKSSKADIDKKTNTSFINNSVFLFQRDNKNLVEIKKVPDDVFNSVNEEDNISLVCNIFPWTQIGSTSADVSCSFKELYVPKVLTTK